MFLVLLGIIIYIVILFIDAFYVADECNIFYAAFAVDECNTFYVGFAGDATVDADAPFLNGGVYLRQRQLVA